MRILIITILTLLCSSALKADEGMWLPYLISERQIELMHEKGLQIPFESVYSHSQPSLKDAIVSLDDGACTGEFISRKGLLLTNHHCGYSEIQQHSNIEHNYLENGFWAKSLSEELANPGKTATLLIEAHDVTNQIITQAIEQSGSERTVIIDSLIQVIEHEAAAKYKLDAKIKPLFSGNTYILFLTQTFRDVRLVGTPPSSIGKFGGDTDNWMWPRHTGDFSFFRVYCAPDGSPADYSPNNIPFEPKMHLKINLQGINKGDYTMTLGYPGHTQRYLTSHGMQEIKDIINPIVAETRGIKQDIWSKAMQSSEEINIKYAAKYSESSNYWKYAIGQNKALEKLGIIEAQIEKEKNFADWIRGDSIQLNKYGKALPVIEASFLLGKKLTLAETITQETMLEGPEIIRFALEISTLYMELQETKSDTKAYQQQLQLCTNTINQLYKDFDAKVDQEVFDAMLGYYLKQSPENLRPEIVSLLGKKYLDDWSGFAAYLYHKSALTNPNQALELIKSKNEDAFFEDPAIAFSYQVLSHFYQMLDIHNKLNRQYNDAQRLLVEGYMLHDNKDFYPDANSTLRLSYGTVGDYEPKDGVRYKYLTTLSGIIEKEDAEQIEFIVPEQLKTLYRNKDFGSYALENGKMPVCFLTNNDITGGNSGSPVLNGKGELIGVAFDGNWEAMTSDLAYEEQLQKCICVDMRYILFILDKMAGAQNLINEMEFIHQ
ncbi:S46 family peptidase [Carboxylicivirga sp. A043]|uniref:S46 family peptidase n=1 Tax=Carboxylicivirga litoralis TaxID=2816963 RepID=UPI0021CB2649|nr:S46 family peptidase [Carboxylicivirga sp. A043]MCU4156417.1 S46 family peptidase [Carboxylicivirga sp. A043]